MRTFLIGVLAAAVVLAGALWFAGRAPGNAEVQRAGHAPDPVATDSTVARPGLEPSTTTGFPAPVPGETGTPEPARADRPELVTLDPPPATASGPSLETTDTVPDATTREELVTVPVEADAPQAGRPELESVPVDGSESTRRDERTDAPVPGQGNTSTR